MRTNTNVTALPTMLEFGKPQECIEPRTQLLTAIVPDGMPNPVRKLSLNIVRAQLWARGLTIRHDDGEYRVNKRNGREATAYYTNDLHDALTTGILMANKGAW
jgi:hypothetical protein